MAKIISESTNLFYEIVPYKMKNDQEITNVQAPLPNQYNFFMLLIGRPNSGKSTFWLNLVNKKSKHTFYKKFDKIYIFSNSLGTIQDKISLGEDRLFEGINDLFNVIQKIKQTEEKTLIIIDDCMSDIKQQEDTITKLIANRRHIGGGISVIISTQIYNKIPLAIRKMASDLVLFSTSNKKEIQAVYDDYSSLTVTDFKRIVRYCFEKGAHEFLYLKIENETYYHNFNLLEF